MRIPICEIAVAQRRRGLDEATVARLMSSIEIIGLLHPITITKRETGYGLVAGLHRLEACRRLGHLEIEVAEIGETALQIELAEIDENLIRAELPPIQRADSHARREEILKEIGRVNEHGGDRKSSGQLGHLKAYASEAAAATGVSPRSVRRDLHRAKGVGPEIRGVLGKMVGSLTGAQLDSIAKASPEQQRHAAEEAKRTGGPEQDKLAVTMANIRAAEARSAAPRESRFNKSERLEIRRSEDFEALQRAYLRLNAEDQQKFRDWAAELHPTGPKIMTIVA